MPSRSAKEGGLDCPRPRPRPSPCFCSWVDVESAGRDEATGGGGMATLTFTAGKENDDEDVLFLGDSGGIASTDLSYMDRRG